MKYLKLLYLKISEYLVLVMIIMEEEYMYTMLQHYQYGLTIHFSKHRQRGQAN